MSKERYRQNISYSSNGNSSIKYDDLERLEEQEYTKGESNNLRIVGLMALMAGVGLVLTQVFMSMLPFAELESFLTLTLPIMGYIAIGYGFFKTLKLMRSENVNFPVLNLYKKTTKRNKTEEKRAKSSPLNTHYPAKKGFKLFHTNPQY